jgi:cytochrome c oxidase subunit 2
VALLASGVSASCGGDVPEASPVRDPVPAARAAQNPSALRQTGPNRYEVQVRAFEGGYRPAEIRVPQGAEITFRVLSEDLPHGFAIDSTSVQIELLPNAFVEATHTFAESGEYLFQCHVYCGGGHETMRGKIIVERWKGRESASGGQVGPGLVVRSAARVGTGLL